MNPPKDLKPRQLVGVFLFIFVFRKKIFIFKNMRKFMLYFAVLVSLTFTACGSGSTTNEVKDSTVSSVDTLNTPSVGGGGSGEAPTRPNENVK